ncbi:MAG: hypothetical protein D6714_08090, partial [Bacteroidetes bacterium]
GFCFLAHPVVAQERLSEPDLAKIKAYEDTIALLSFLVINDSLPDERFAACRKLIPTLVQALKTPNSFQYKFPKVKNISILYPRDSSFRVFTWQLYVDVNDYRYYGAIQMNEPTLKLFPLVDRSAEVSDEEFAVLPHKKWYGAVYYNLLSFDSPEGPKHLLFGFDGYSFFEKRKVVDVLSFEDGQPVFGAPVFLTYDEKSGAQFVKNRIVKTYSAEASFKLNYDLVYDAIVFDHLQLMPNTPGYPSYVPDGSYEGYRLEGGLWHHIPKMFHQVQDKPPREYPILDQRKGTSIMGRKKKG